MASRIRFGIIGWNEAAFGMMQAIDAAENAEVVAIMSADPQELADLGQMISAATTTDPGEILASESVDAVYIVPALDERLALARRAAEAGKHILLDDPIAAGLAEADELIAACEAQGLHLGVAAAAPVDAALSTARDVVRAGMLGDLLAVRITLDAGSETDALRALVPAWNELAWVTGLTVEKVYAQSAGADGMQAVVLTLRCAGGAVGSVQIGAGLPGGLEGEEQAPRIYGTRGQLVLTEEPRHYATFATEGTEANAWHPLLYAGARGSREEVVRGFAAAILGEGRVPASGAYGRPGLQLLEAVRRSLQAGQPVSLA